MTWFEFKTLLIGLGSGRTSLSNIIQIRSETDEEILKHFTPEQRKIRNDWLNKHQKVATREEYELMMKNMKNVFREAFGNKKKNSK